jgi:hypothetical protein
LLFFLAGVWGGGLEGLGDRGIVGVRGEGSEFAKY